MRTDRTHYDTLFRTSLETVTHSGFSFDEQVLTPEDQRSGITVILRLKAPELLRSINSMLDAFRAIEPDQYYYPVTDLHVTVMGLIECHNGFSISKETLLRHRRYLEEALLEAPAFTLEFTGITISPSCILVQGFPDSEILDHIRDAIRIRYQSEDILHTIDSRYVLKTAHVTVVRIIRPVTEQKRMLDTIAEYREHSFGVEQVERLELVMNDWCLREQHTELVSAFSLKEE